MNGFNRKTEARHCLRHFDYELPKELIAQRPPKERESARLLVIDRKTGILQDRRFEDIIDYFNPGDGMVLNDTKVISAELRGRKSTGGKVEVLLLNPTEEGSRVWHVLLRPPLKRNREVMFDEHSLRGIYRDRDRNGIALMEFNTPDIVAYAHRCGEVPLPPYIRRPSDAEDRLDYQTVYAAEEGAVAAPTAGLHFTRKLLDRIMLKGVHVFFVTLHVGYGSFKPVRDIEGHRMHAERFELKQEIARGINGVRTAGGRIWAVGTTTVRVLETCALRGQLVAGKGETDLFIYPPADFEIVQGLLTNFHLPRTTLLMLVSAFMGQDLMRRAYEHAVGQRYRFYSYGDAMLIL